MKKNSEKISTELARGASIVFVGILLMYIIRFLYRVIVSRYLGPEGYGLLSLGDMVMNFGYMLALIGLDVGLMKHLAFFHEKNDISRLKGSFWGTIIIASILSSIIITILIVFSNYIAIGFFKNPKFAPILIIFAIAIPLSIFARIISQTMLTFNKQLEDIYTKVLSRDLLNLLLVITTVFLGGTIIQISLVYLISLIISITIGYIIIEWKVFPFFRNKTKPIFEYKKRISFALPLFFSAVFINVMLWTDTLLIGFFTSITQIGVYNVALPLAAGLGIFLASFARVFYPTIARLIAKNEIKEIPIIYNNMSRWIFLLSFPVLLILISFSKEVISILFGPQYISGRFVLIILSFAYFTEIIVGPTTETLISFHKNKIVFWLNGFTVIGNILLNLILIPKYGIIGAAIATGVSIFVKEVISLIIVKKMINLKINKNNYLKGLFAGLVSLFISKLTYNILPHSLKSVEIIIIVLFIFIVLYLSILFLSKGINKEEKLMIKNVLKKIFSKITLKTNEPK